MIEKEGARSSTGQLQGGPESKDIARATDVQALRKEADQTKKELANAKAELSSVKKLLLALSEQAGSEFPKLPDLASRLEKLETSSSSFSKEIADLTLTAEKFHFIGEKLVQMERRLSDEEAALEALRTSHGDQALTWLENRVSQLWEGERERLDLDKILVAESNDNSEEEERESELQSRLENLESAFESFEGAIAKVDQSAGQSDQQLLASFRTVVNDVRRCIQRCELLEKLPEIRVMVKRYERSLAIHAVLSDRWKGEREPKVEEEEEGSERRFMSHGNENSRSSPDLGRTGPARFIGRQKANGKNKQFRTVADWIKPHTPMVPDPVWKGTFASSPLKLPPLKTNQWK